MKVCLDVQYHPDHAIAAAMMFDHWTDAIPIRVVTQRIDEVAPYEPGAFYKRELPCLLAVLETFCEPLETIIVDGFVWLDDQNKRGLGAHLFDALEKRITVVGVAKTAFTGAPALEVLRGQSKQPLFVNSIGCDQIRAAQWIANMHGEHRVPTLLKAVDQLARGRAIS
jgi:deoxyribonuclease V